MEVVTISTGCTRSGAWHGQLQQESQWCEEESSWSGKAGDSFSPEWEWERFSWQEVSADGPAAQALWQRLVMDSANITMTMSNETCFRKTR